MKIFENLNLNNLNGEIWKIIKYYSDYKVSNYGRIKSLKFRKEKILKQNKNSAGYLHIDLCKNGKKETKQIHVLVFEAFIHKIEKGYTIHHKDENQVNNIFNNFDYIIREKHISLHHKNKIILDKTKKLMSKNHANFKGENHPLSKLKDYDIIEIREYLDCGHLTQKQIGKLFNVSTMTISKIKNNKIWKHLK